MQPVSIHANTDLKRPKREREREKNQENSSIVSYQKIEIAINRHSPATFTPIFIGLVHTRGYARVCVYARACLYEACLSRAPANSRIWSSSFSDSAPVSKHRTLANRSATKIFANCNTCRESNREKKEYIYIVE